MIRIGRYEIAFGRSSFQRIAADWMLHPFRVWHFLWFWFIKKARPTDIDKKQQYPTGTPLEYEGIRYHYYKAKEDIDKGVYVGRNHTT